MENSIISIEELKKTVDEKEFFFTCKKKENH